MMLFKTEADLEMEAAFKMVREIYLLQGENERLKEEVKYLKQLVESLINPTINKLEEQKEPVTE